jgi:hypothetical protein
MNTNKTGAAPEFTLHCYVNIILCLYLYYEQAVEYMDITHETDYNIKLDTVKLNF